MIEIHPIEMAGANPALRYAWPAADCTRIPYGMYRDPDVFALEQKRIFQGPVWNYLALEAEIPDGGDFRTIAVGDVPVIVNRSRDGTIHAFVNRCAHRGATVQRSTHGNTRAHVCCYHHWGYNLEGKLIGVPFQRGVDGKGGLPEDFDKSRHCLRPMRIATLNGVIFGTFSDATEPLEDFLDTPFVAQLKRLFNRPIKVLGYQRQRIRGNWKLYTDNLRDPNHGGLLHAFQVTFGIARLNQTGGAKLDRRGRHNMSWAAQEMGRDHSDQEYSTPRDASKIALRDATLLQYRKEFPDNYNLTIASIFPNCIFQQIGNTLAVRQIRTTSVDEFEIFWTFYGYEDDDQSMTDHRLRMSNLVGPAGLVSMEDGEAIEIVHRAIAADEDKHAFVEFGGRGPVGDSDTLITESPMRGFWMYYCELMGIVPGEAAHGAA
ncbi:Rieske 2Fe-2S domain-containing protein [Caballeronia sp. LZ043]|uniref:Rieske 2Fe-2S domain-containing protein n=1 Tax=Caballeronia sp. LZ043 TaxID=3038569 RepID=UPI00285FD92C|nr:Rieske 2Fe-2S domain-containing protein [Caballeronia sp. LZ043]MDR5822465.1 Rieske 2Fe-2S domain-containing protein [Caballeronia sp. LZ043]